MHNHLKYFIKIRDFEKISFKQFVKDVSSNKTLYNTYKLPTRYFRLTAGETIAQGMFFKYLITKSDTNLGLERGSDY